jgi:hypothetical protein
MTNQNLLDHSGLGGSPTMSGSTKWHASVASGNPTEMDSRLNPTESRTKGRRGAVMAFWIFLALLIMLSGAAIYLLRAKLNGQW